MTDVILAAVGLVVLVVGVAIVAGFGVALIVLGGALMAAGAAAATLGFFLGEEGEESSDG